MSLESPERIQGATSILNGIFSSPLIPTGKAQEGTEEREKETETDKREIQLPNITLTSLHPMHQPWSTSILYTSPQDPHSHLQTFCQSLKDTFTTAGFMLPEEKDEAYYCTLRLSIQSTFAAYVRIPTPARELQEPGMHVGIKEEAEEEVPRAMESTKHVSRLMHGISFPSMLISHGCAMYGLRKWRFVGWGEEEGGWG
ncbi:hypothetical protein H4I96_08734 [Botrytis cinerea]